MKLLFLLMALIVTSSCKKVIWVKPTSGENMNNSTKKKPDVQPPTKPEINPIQPAEPTSPINPQVVSKK